MDTDEMRRRLALAPVGHLATVGADGRPHLVPVCFCADGDRVYWAVDHKPKSTTDLQRLRNLAANRRAALLVDHYEDDWDRLWWIRADCTVEVLAPGAEAERALDELAEKYPPYRRQRPPGPVVRMRVERLSGWAASGA